MQISVEQRVRFLAATMWIRKETIMNLNMEDYVIQAAGRELPREETGYSFFTDWQSKGR